MTAQELISDSLTLAGQLGPGRGAGVSESQVALRALNSMIGAWATQRLTIPVIRSDEYTLTPSTGTYTIGDGGDFDAARPVKIERANLIDLTNPSSPLHQPLRVITVTAWADIRLPTLTSTVPTHLYYMTSYPLGQIKLWPVPTAANRVELFTQEPLSRIATLTEDLEFVPDPPGYEEAVKYNLAVRLKTLFPKAMSSSPPAQVALVDRIARESLGNIKRMNKVTPVLRCEPIVRSDASAGFDYRIGE